MFIVSTTGYIIEIIHPYLARNNDAMILGHFIQTQDGDSLKQLLGPNGVILADRGFRDILWLLKSIDIECHVPSFLQKKQTAFSTESANDMRKLTKVRSTVERCIGRVKQFKLFKGIVPIRSLPTVANDLTITASLINRFRIPLTSDNPEDTEWAKMMMARVKTSNELQKRIENGELKSKSKFI